MNKHDGDGGQIGPWGNKSAAPDLEALVRRWQARLKQFADSDLFRFLKGMDPDVTAAQDQP